MKYILFSILLAFIIINIPKLSVAQGGEIEKFIKAGMEQYNDGNIQGSKEFIDRAYNYAEKQDILEQKVFCLFIKGALYESILYETNDTTYFKKGIMIIAKTDPEKINRLLKIFLRVGDLMEENGHHFQASQMYLSSLNCYKYFDEKSGMQKTYNRRGNYHYYNLEYNKAIAYFDSALTVSVEMDSTELILCNSLKLGNLYQALSEYDAAKKYYNYSRELSKTTQDLNALYESYIGLGQIYERLGFVDKALTYFDSTICIASELGDTTKLIIPLLNIGKIGGSSDTTITMLYWSMNYLKNNDPEAFEQLQVSIISSIANKYMLNGEYKKAITFYDSSLIIVAEKGLLELAKQISVNIIVAHVCLGNYEIAIRQLENLNLFPDIDTDVRTELNMHKQLSLCYYHTGNIDEAIKHLESAIDLIEEIRNMVKDVGRIDFFEREYYYYLFLGELYYKKKLYKNAYGIVEQSTARYLKEVVNKKTESTTSNLENFQKILSEDELVLFYGAIMDINKCRILIFTISKEKFTVDEIHYINIEDHLLNNNIKSIDQA
ncbi:MAG: tetratricopeptide repeat protein, partial [Bacteroidales bacterium]|nr:tetratricopeptide repeat protein [Bacteroidales bacterium]